MNTIDKDTKISILKHKNNIIYSHCGDLPEDCLEHIASLKIPSSHAVQVFPSDEPDTYDIIATSAYMKGDSETVAKKAQKIVDAYSKIAGNWRVNISKTENVITVKDEDNDICLLKAELQISPSPQLISIL